MYPTPFVWYRLTLELKRIHEEARSLRGGSPKPPREHRGLIALVALGILLVGVPLVVVLVMVHIVRLRFTPFSGIRNVHLVLALVAEMSALALYILNLFWGFSDDSTNSFTNSFLTIRYIFLWWYALGLGFGIIQSGHNNLISFYGVPLEFDNVADMHTVNRLKLNPPPGWPAVPTDWSPTVGRLHIDPRWDLPPRGWRLWSLSGGS
jgi:hypothetical protein